MVKVKPPTNSLFYIGIDGTNAIDTVVWGHLWNAKFGWKNLLWQLDKDPADGQRRIDKAHALLPILRQQFKHNGNDFADTCIMPEGKDGKGVDSKWTSSTDPKLNVVDMNTGLQFMRTFILNPSADKATSSLNDSGKGVSASVVFISSHGSQLGDMFGETSYHTTGVDYLFSLTEAAVSGKTFAAPDWVLLSNCFTLIDLTFNDWLILMQGAKPLRGAIGFQKICPLAEPSARIFSTFIDRLEKGKTLLDAWSGACAAHGIAKRWVLLCHENAKGDTIADWNAGKLKPIPAGSSKILMFNDANPTGVLVTPTPEPFEVFWSKGTPPTRITTANRNGLANKLGATDIINITVRPASTVPPAKFIDKTDISITLIYIRENYLQAINVNKMFKVKGTSGTSPLTTKKLNSSRPSAALGSDDGDDSWILQVTGTPTEVSLTLECVDLDLSKHNQHNVPYWLRVNVKPPASSTTQFDFTRNGSILVK